MNTQRKRFHRREREQPHAQPHRRGDRRRGYSYWDGRHFGTVTLRNLAQRRELGLRATRAQRILLATLDARRVGRERMKPDRRKAFLDRVARRDFGG